MHSDLEKIARLLEEVDESREDEKLLEAFDFDKREFKEDDLDENLSWEVMEQFELCKSLRERIAKLTQPSPDELAGAEPTGRPLFDSETGEYLDFFASSKSPALNTLLSALLENGLDLRSSNIPLSNADKAMAKAMVAYNLTAEWADTHAPNAKRNKDGCYDESGS